MDKKFVQTGPLRGSMEVPGDKSITHRALIIGSMCNGPVRISNLSTGADCKSTRDCLESIGVVFHNQGDAVIVDGSSGFSGPEGILDAGNSGTTIRLLSGLLAAQKFDSEITGDDSLRRRPMSRIVDPLMKMGARITASGENSNPPLQIFGAKLRAIEYVMPVASAQVKSSILLAGLHCNDDTVVIEKQPTRDHTERMLMHLGADIITNDKAVSVKRSNLEANEIYVPGDISSAIFFIVAGLLVPNSEITINSIGLNPTRTSCLDYLKKMGADLDIVPIGKKNNEPVGNITVRSGKLRAVDISPNMVPGLIDEIPILSLVASTAEGDTTIRGAGELRYKESDRIRSTALELAKLGINISETENGLNIRGNSRLHGAEVASHGDHRLAMTLSIAGLIAEGETVVQNAEAVGISLPEFYEKTERLAGGNS